MLPSMYVRILHQCSTLLHSETCVLTYLDCKEGHPVCPEGAAQLNVPELGVHLTHTKELPVFLCSAVREPVMYHTFVPYVWAMI